MNLLFIIICYTYRCNPVQQSTHRHISFPYDWPCLPSISDRRIYTRKNLWECRLNTANPSPWKSNHNYIIMNGIQLLIQTHIITLCVWIRNWLFSYLYKHRWTFMLIKIRILFNYKTIIFSMSCNRIMYMKMPTKKHAININRDHWNMHWNHCTHFDEKGINVHWSWIQFQFSICLMVHPYAKDT